MTKKVVKMNARDLTLNIAVNLGRLSRWAEEKKEARIKQFLSETEQYLEQLKAAPKNRKFNRTLSKIPNPPGKTGLRHGILKLIVIHSTR